LKTEEMMMSQVLDLELQHCIMNAIAHEAQMAGAAVQQAAACYERPSAVFRPRLSVDGNQWCALYGDNVQDGVAGFGDSPADAMWDFDRNWSGKLPAKVASPALDAMMGRAEWPSAVAG
jgi:hypothetical protein